LDKDVVEEMVEAVATDEEVNSDEVVEDASQGE
jgi:hypothetical protein